MDELTALDAIEQTYRDQGAKLLRALYAYTGSAEIAEDAVAEAFAQALRSRDQIRNVEPWIWRVAFRKAARDLQRKERSAPSEAGSPRRLRSSARSQTSRVRMPSSSDSRFSMSSITFLQQRSKPSSTHGEMHLHRAGG